MPPELLGGSSGEDPRQDHPVIPGDCSAMHATKQMNLDERRSVELFTLLAGVHGPGEHHDLANPIRGYQWGGPAARP